MMNAIRSHDTPAWYFYAWASFAIATSLMGFGIYYTPVDLWVKGYLFMGMFFCIGSTFTLSKTIRDRHESQRDGELLSQLERRTS